MNTQDYQRKIFLDAVKKLLKEHRVGLDIFTRGGKSYIAMDIIDYMLSRESDKNTYALILGPKSVLDNLEGNVMSNFKYKNNLLFLNYEKLSRHITITGFLKENNIDKNSLKLIVMDEAHKAFGEICRKTFLEDEEYIYSKYVVAMTATPYSNLSGINSLDELVGENNIIRYHYDEAIKDKVARKINYIPAILNYDSAVINKIADIRKNCSDNDYLVQLLDRFEKLNDKLASNEAKAISSYITENTTLDLSDGARVFVFFSSIEKLELNKDIAIDAILEAYRSWGNSIVKYRYMNFTSASTEDEIDDIREKLASNPIENTVDIICTVQMGVMGMHPSNTHFAILMSATTSLQKMMQMIGRVTNLYAYDNTDTTIFDLKDSLSAIGRVHYNTNSQDIIKDLLSIMYKDDIKDIDEYTSLVNIKSSKISNESLELLEKIEYIADTINESDSVIQYINDNLSVIDDLKNGNILDFFENRKRTEPKDFERRSILKKQTVYKSLLNIIFSDAYDNDIKRAIRQKLRIFKHRIYILESYNRQQCIKIKNTFIICRKAVRDKEKSEKLISYVIEPIVMDNALTGAKRIVIDMGILKWFSKEELEDIRNNVISRQKAEEERIKQEEEQRRLEEENKLQMYAKMNQEMKQREKEERARRKQERDKEKLLKYASEDDVDTNKDTESDIYKERREITVEALKLVNNTIEDINNDIEIYKRQIKDYSIIFKGDNYCTIRIKFHKYDARISKIGLIKRSVEYYRKVCKNLELMSDIVNKLQAYTNSRILFDYEVKTINKLIKESNNLSENSKYYIEGLDDSKESMERILDENKISLRSATKIQNLKNRFGDSNEINIECKTVTDYNENKKEIENIIGRRILNSEIGSDLYDTIEKNSNNRDFIVALFITILNKEIKDYHTAGYYFNTRLDDNDIEKLKNKLKEEVGEYESCSIIQEAERYNQSQEVKNLVNMAFNNGESRSIEDELNCYSTIHSNKDTVIFNLCRILNIDSDIDYDKLVSKFRNEKGFKFYSDVLKMNIKDQKLLDAIHRSFERNIKETFRLAMHYALVLEDEVIIDEIFGTDKYNDLIIQYIESTGRNASKVKSVMNKYSKVS